MPAFSVVIATFARDELIVPTLDSVRQQSLSDFEVLVVSDGPPSSALRNIVDGYGKRFALLALPERSRSQSGPNNLGWSAARGEFIAYLGHDDVWHRDHLRYLAATFADHPQLDFAVSGCLFLGPPGTENGYRWITGVFDDDDPDAPLKYLFPPSSISHRRELPECVGRWPHPLTSQLPVDAEFILGAAQRQCSFASTRRISVFKFASALRYLSYYCPEDVEQQQILHKMQDGPAFEAFLEETLAACIAHGGFMAPVHAARSQSLPGERIAKNEIVRGISLPDVNHLRGRAWIGVGDDNRGFDWHAPETFNDQTWRWSGPSHRPRMLLPYTSEHEVAIEVQVAKFATEDIARSLRVVLDGHQVDTRIVWSGERFLISFVARLRNDAPSVLEFRMNRTAPASEVDPHSTDTRRFGLCLLGISLQPLVSPVE